MDFQDLPDALEKSGGDHWQTLSDSRPPFSKTFVDGRIEDAGVGKMGVFSVPFL